MSDMLLGFNKKVITVDLHNMQVWEAERYFDELLKNIVADEIEVVHGFNNGTALANWLRKQYKHKRIEQKIVGMNKGITILKLKK